MTKIVFEDVIKDCSDRMHQKFPGEKIAIVMDNCSSHLINFSPFENLEIIFLPPQTTAYLQPLDQGYFHTVKANLIRWQREYIVLQDHKPSMKEKINEFIDVACRIQPEVITKFWRMAGLITEENPEDEFDAELHVLQRIENVEQQPMEKEEYELLILPDSVQIQIDHNANNLTADHSIEYHDGDPDDAEEFYELREFLPPTMDYSFQLPDAAFDVLTEGFYQDEPNEDTQGSLSDEQLRQFVNNFD